MGGRGVGIAPSTRARRPDRRASGRHSRIGRLRSRDTRRPRDARSAPFGSARGWFERPRSQCSHSRGGASGRGADATASIVGFAAMAGPSPSTTIRSIGLAAHRRWTKLSVRSPVRNGRAGGGAARGCSRSGGVACNTIVLPRASSTLKRGSPAREPCHRRVSCSARLRGSTIRAGTEVGCMPVPQTLPGRL
jgi:hypothetical protein